jgi:hypothetical protein
LANGNAPEAANCYKEGVIREISAGGVLVRVVRGRPSLAVEEAPRLLAYRGEREMAALAWEKMQE